MSLAVLDELKVLGVEIVPQGENLVIRPASKVPPDLKARLRAQKPAILAALRSRTATACRYDWQPGYRGLRLACVAHHHALGTATVFRMSTGGRDVLLEMAEAGILTGQAWEDSRKAN
jgi:hypothetical protein